jgi:membrane protease YdiL (CAAX protease family)
MDDVILKRFDTMIRAVAAWAAFMAGLLAGGDIEDAASFAVAAVAGAALVAAGVAAVSRCRPLAPHSNAQRLRLAVFALAAGTVLGFANLAVNWAIAAAHPAFRELLTRRVTTLAQTPITGVVSAPLVEEVLLRLFLLSAIAWIVSRFTTRRRLPFVVGLFASSVIFALLHLDRPMPPDAMLAWGYRAALVVKYTLAGLPLGWIYWRWGLPYSILCHAAVNAAHLVLQRGVF